VRQASPRCQGKKRAPEIIHVRLRNWSAWNASQGWTTVGGEWPAWLRRRCLGGDPGLAGDGESACELKASKLATDGAILDWRYAPWWNYELRSLSFSEKIVRSGGSDSALRCAPRLLPRICRSGWTIPGTLSAHSIMGVCFGRRHSRRNLREGTRNSRGVGLSAQNPERFSSAISRRERGLACRDAGTNFDCPP